MKAASRTAAQEAKGDDLASFPGHLTVLEARGLYFERNHLDDGGYNSSWVKVKVGWISYYMPNPKARKEAVPYHDLNHIIAEYAPSVSGESIVAGYEVGSGIGRFWLGWVISSQAMLLGLLYAPRQVFHAFLRGRRSLCTYDLVLDDALLGSTMSELRRRLGVPPKDAPLEATAADWRAFVLHCGVTLLAHALAVLALVALWR